MLLPAAKPFCCSILFRKRVSSFRNSTDSLNSACANCRCTCSLTCVHTGQTSSNRGVTVCNRGECDCMLIGLLETAHTSQQHLARHTRQHNLLPAGAHATVCQLLAASGLGASGRQPAIVPPTMLDSTIENPTKLARTRKLSKILPATILDRTTDNKLLQ